MSNVNSFLSRNKKINTFRLKKSALSGVMVKCTLQVLEQQQKQQAVLQQQFQKHQQEQLERQRQQQEQLQSQQHKHQEYMKEHSKSQKDSATEHEKENVRPKVHMKAWATPSPHPPAPAPPVVSTQQNLVTHASPYTGKSTHTNVTVTSVSNASATVNTATNVPVKVTDQIVNSVPSQQVTTQQKNLKQETNTTLVNAQNGSQVSQTGIDKNLSFLETVTNNLDQVQNTNTYNNYDSQSSKTASDKTVQYQTPAVSSTAKTNNEKSASETKSVNSNKTVSNSPKVPSYQGYYISSYADRYNATKVPNATETSTADTSKMNGSIAKGTLGFVDGQLSLFSDGQVNEDVVDTADTDSVSTLCDDREQEVKGECRGNACS